MLPTVRSARSPMQEIGPGKRVASGFASCGSTYGHQPVLVRNRRIGSEQDALNPTEDGGVRTDPQRQTENCQRGKPRTAPEHPEAEAEVLQRRLDQRQSSLVSVDFLGLLDAAEAAKRLTTGVFGGHAFSQVQFD